MAWGGGGIRWSLRKRRYNAPMPISHEQLAELLSGHSQIKLAILFGSQAGGTPSAASDIDLALLGDGPLPSRLKLELWVP